MTDAAGCRRDATAGPPADAEPEVETDADPDSEAVAAEIRSRAERVRRQELDAELGRLEACGDPTTEQRRAVADLSASIAGALVDRWTAALVDDAVADAAVDSEIARDLLTE